MADEFRVVPEELEIQDDVATSASAVPATPSADPASPFDGDPDERVNIVLRDGTPADVPRRDLERAMGAGAHIDTAAEATRRDQLALSRSTGGKAVSAIMGADEAILGAGSGLGFALLEATSGKMIADETRDAIREMRDENPLSGLAGNTVAGFALGGPSELIGTAGSSAAVRVGKTALGAGLEGLVGGLGNAMVERNLGNPEANSEDFFVDRMAGGFLMGAGVGVGLGALGEIGRRSMARLGGAVMGAGEREGSKLVDAAATREGRIQDIMASGKYTTAEAEKVLTDMENVGRVSVVERTTDSVAQKTIADVAKTDPELSKVLEAAYKDGSTFARTGKAQLEEAARALAKDGDGLLKLQDELYDISISGKNTRMGELVDASRANEAMDAVVTQSRELEAFLDKIDALPNRANAGNFSTNARKQLETFRQAIQGRTREVTSAETKLLSKAEDLTSQLSRVEETIQEATARIEKNGLQTPPEVRTGRRVVDQSTPASQTREARRIAQRDLEVAEAQRDILNEKIAKNRADIDAIVATSKPSLTPKAVEPSQLFMEMDNLKRNFGKLRSQIGMNAEGGLLQEFRRVYEGMQRTLEDAGAWGDEAAAAQREVNEAWTRRLSTQSDLEKSFMRDFGNFNFEKGQRVDAGKMQSYLNRITDPSADLDREALHNWFDSLENAMNQTEKHYGEGKTFSAGREQISRMRKLVEESEQKAKIHSAIAAQRTAEGSGLELGILGGGKVGLALGLVSDYATRPLKTIERLSAIRDSAARMESTIKRATDGLFGSGRGAVKSADDAMRKSVRGDVSAVASRIRDYVRQPEILQKKLADQLEGMATAAPEHARQIAQVATRAAVYLSQHAPIEQKYQNMFGPQKTRPLNDWQADSFARRVRTVEDPMSAVRDAARGRLQHDQVDTLKNVYPSIYDRLRQNAIDQIGQMQKRGSISMPYAKQLQVGILLSFPANYTMTPGFIQTMQLSKGGTAGPMPSKNAPSADQSSHTELSQDPLRGPTRRSVKISRDFMGTDASHIEAGGSQRKKL